MEFKTTSGHAVEIRTFLPQKYAVKQQMILSKGKTLDEIGDGKVDAGAALEALAVIVDGMVVKLDDSSENIQSRLENINSVDYSEISAKCTDALNQDKKKTTSN